MAKAFWCGCAGSTSSSLKKKKKKRYKTAVREPKGIFLFFSFFFLGPLATSVGTQQYCFQKAQSLSPKSLACLGTPLLLPFPPLQKSPTQL